MDLSVRFIHSHFVQLFVSEPPAALGAKRLVGFVVSIFLSELHAHLSGLSELPLKQRLILLLAGEPFRFCSPHFYQRAFLLHLFVLWAFFICQEHVVVERLPKYRKHSTAQRNQPCTKQQTKYVPIRARQHKQADKSRREPACRRAIYSLLRRRNERRNRNLPGVQNCASTHEAASLV